MTTEDLSLGDALLQRLGALTGQRSDPVPAVRDLLEPSMQRN